VSGPGILEASPRIRPGMVAAVAAGIAAGGVAGAIMRGSGMMYTNLFVAACLLIVVALAGLGALAAALTGRTSAARGLAGFAGVAVITTGIAYVIAPPFRDPNADPIHRGSATVHTAELAPSEWVGQVTCRTGPGDPAVFLVWMPHVRVGDKDVAVLLNLRPGATPVQADKLTIATLSPTVIADYIASPGDGLDTTLIDATGLSGALRFSADVLPNPARLHNPEIDRVTGTFEWTCDPTRSE
jgi:hypothetical protein